MSLSKKERKVVSKLLDDNEHEVHAEWECGDREEEDMKSLQNTLLATNAIRRELKIFRRSGVSSNES